MNLLQPFFTLSEEDVEDVANLLDEKVQIAFRFLMMQIKYDNEKYQKKCKKIKQNTMKRWSQNANDANAFFAMHKKEKENEKEIETEKETEKEIEKENEKEKEKENSSRAAKDIIYNNGKAVKAAAAAKIDYDLFEKIKANRHFLPNFRGFPEIVGIML